jgi:CheY-like chemotaxis protein
MGPTQQSLPILVVDDDKVLREVLTRVLSRQGSTVVAAAGVAEALRLAEQQNFSLGLIDLRLDDGDGRDLAERLAARQPGLPLLLMTAYPLQFRERPDFPGRFRRVLTKPLNLDELRQAITDAVREEPMNPPLPPSSSPSEPTTPAPAAPAATPAIAAVSMGGGRFAWMKSAATVVLALVVLAAFGAFMVGAPIPFLPGGKEDFASTPPPLGVELVPDKPHTLSAPDEVKESLGIRKGGIDGVSVAVPPDAARTRPLTLTGSTAVDPGRILRIRVRFTPAEVVRLAQRPEIPDPTQTSSQPMERELRSGDEVKAGDFLAGFYSDVVGSKKNDLFDAVSDLKLNKEILASAQSSAAAVPAFIWQSKRAVEADKNNISRALNTLRTWGVPERDIQAVIQEAESSSGTDTRIDKAKLEEWGRVELHVPQFGSTDEHPVVVERNLTLHELVQDPTISLFQIAKVDRLLVVAYASEDDLPELLKLMEKPPAERQWTIQTAGAKDGLPGVISDIGYFSDPNQHSLMVKGYIHNPGLRIRGTQLATVGIALPPPDDVVEIDVNAVVEEGRQTLVWVQTDAKKSHYTLRRVKVTHRFDKTVYVKSKLDPKEAVLSAEDTAQGLPPLEPLHAGEKVLKSGVLELKKELEDRESNSGKGS